MATCPSRVSPPLAAPGIIAAQLVASIHQPLRAPVGECLERWRRLGEAERAAAYLVLEGPEPSVRRTLNARQIAELAG